MGFSANHAGAGPQSSCTVLIYAISMQSASSSVANIGGKGGEHDVRLTGPVFQIDPLTDYRWPLLVDRDPNSTIFHTRNWLTALHLTFGYDPKVFTLSAPNEELQNGIPFCEVRSWLTGHRLVGLPFSDHCDPLGSDAEVNRLLQYLSLSFSQDQLKYVEIRPLRTFALAGFSKAESFHLHLLDLQPDLYDIFSGFQKSSIQRTIRRAERLGLQISDGCSDWHLINFYKLFALTRRRLQAPPQPIEWFQNLVTCLGPRMNISIALHQAKPIAALVTIRHKDVVTYKYGASDERFHNLGGVSFLFWNAIRQAKLNGATGFDFGRTDVENVGLATFKSRWGAAASELAYWRCGEAQEAKWKNRVIANAAKWSFGKLPAATLIKIGRLLYRHVG